MTSRLVKRESERLPPRYQSMKSVREFGAPRVARLDASPQ
jgi:hypothetical protein